jgi:hypothetical protein
MAFARHTALRLGKPNFSSAKAAAPQPLGGGGLMMHNAFKDGLAFQLFEMPSVSLG